MTYDQPVVSAGTDGLIEQPWSVTHIETFENCPRRYAAEVVFKTVEFEETEAMRNGKIKHQQLYLRMQRSPIPLPSELECLEPVCASFQQSGTIHAELGVSITKDLKHTQDWYNRDRKTWHRGRIDLALILNNPTLGVVVDWKDGNPKNEKPFQGKVYAFDMMVRFPELEKVSAMNVWLGKAQAGDNPLGVVQKFTRKDHYQQIAAELMQRADNIDRARKAGSWPPMQNPLCGWCRVMGCEFNPNKK